MGILDKAKDKAMDAVDDTKDKAKDAKDLAESTIAKGSDISLEEADKVGSVLSKALGKVTDMGMKGVDVFLETDEGKKVKMQILKHYLQKYWMLIAAVAAFDIIGIFATIKYSLTKR